MPDMTSSDYIAGYRDGMISTNGMINAKLHLVRMYVEELINQTTKPESLTEIKNYAEENK
jgi:hypothetical protein